MSKTNGNGRECPEWCERDHENDIPYTCNKTTTTVAADEGHIWAWADLDGCTSDPAPEIGIYAAPPDGKAGGLSFTSQADAVAAALFIENMADHTPDSHRQAAAQLREYAAAAWPEKEPEAG